MRRAVLSCFLAALLFAALLTASSPTGAEEEKAADPRVATVAAVEGASYVRPGGARRWTPLSPDDVLLPGDQVKAATRGANALELVLADGGGLVLGPGGLVSFVRRGLVRLLAGDVELSAPAAAPVALETPDGVTRNVTDPVWFSVRGEKVRQLDEAPRWLTGYRDSVGTEWMGSLLAQVDGRNVPLSVGYHKVTADIRDQIARTTVEQSFVNATGDVLEGVFYFPLPADASISGFGMWIGNELVEADLVEKARARQIYEDILRRKKDPGLLEWQGGNLFQARVYPIPPHAEKRIRIRYTQVLALQGSSYRYRYALRSELLRSHPLRRLDIQVNVASARPLGDVTCPTHAARIRTTEHDAQVTFDAESFVPERDFEVQVSLPPGPAATAIANRRGDDGTFAVFLNPPEPEAAGWSRDLTPEGAALDLILLADTSGSMDEGARDVQRDFLDAFLTQLGDDDRVRLWATDVGVEALLAEPRPGGAATASEALALLDARASLGWTDLDGALKEALAAAGPDTLVVYVGDGIPTTGDADPNAAADRLRVLGEGASASVHAVATSSSYEQVVLEALASIGGSLRRADDDPVGAAAALLAEVARPSVRDMKLRIEGVRTAKVYPQTLANLPLGRQRIVLGRYLPTAESQRAEVVLTGTLEGESVTWRAPLVLPASDGGNDFLPRLWARRHLDHLLAQGSSKEIQEQIVAFSRRFGIITPYTSFLVLESDEDRERYGVERTVSMRDGEVFFAEGRDRVALEMRRQASREAEAWRLALRQQMRREIDGLGRDLLPDMTFVALGAVFERADAERTVEHAARRKSEGGRPELKTRSGGIRGGWGAEGGDGSVDRGLAPPPPAAAGGPAQRLGEDRQAGAPPEADYEEAKNAADDLPAEEAGEPVARRRSRGRRLPASESDEKLGRPMASYAEAFAARKENLFLVQDRVPLSLRASDLGFPPPSLPPAPASDAPLPPWSPEAIETLRRLDRRDALAALPGGLRLVLVDTSLHPVRGDETTRPTTSTLLVGPGRWSVQEVLRVAYTDADTRATADPVRRLGRARARLESDVRAIPFPFPDRSAEDLVRSWEDREIRVEAMDADLARLVVDGSTLDEDRLVLTIDRTRGLLQELRRVSPWGRTLERQVFEDVVEVYGIPFATTITTTDARGRVTRRVTRTVEALEPAAFDAAFEASVSGLDDVVWLGDVLPSVKEAREVVKEGHPGVDHYVVDLLDLLDRAQNDEALALWKKVYAYLDGRPGREGLDAHVQLRLRRGVELERRLEAMTAATDLVEGPRASAYAAWIDDLGAQALGPREQLRLLDRLAPRWTAAGPRAALAYGLRRVQALFAADDAVAARALRATLLDAYPTNVDLVIQRTGDLEALGRPDEAVALLETTLEGEPRFTENDLQRLYDRLTDLLWNARDLARLEPALDAYVAAVPAHPDAWRRKTSLLYLTRREAEADAFVLDQLAAPVPTSPDTPAWARMVAAVDLALGRLWFVHARQIHAPFVDPLVDEGIKLGVAEAPTDPVGALLESDYYFGRTDGKRRLQDAWRAEVLAHASSLPPLILTRLLGWIPWRGNPLPDEDFQRVFDAVGARLRAATSRAERRTLGEAWERMARAHGDAARVAGVLRARRDLATGRERRARELALFDHLLTMSWDEAIEREVGALLPTFLDPDDDARASRVAALGARRFAAWSFEGRKKAAMPAPDVWETLSRAAGRAAEREAAQVARRGLVAVLATLAGRASPPLASWLQVERLGYAVELGEDVPSIEAGARELLDQIPVSTEDEIDAILAERAVLVLDYAAIRRDAQPGLADRTLAWLQARAADPLDRRLDWRYEIFRLLLALDRDAELEAFLRSWAESDTTASTWRPALAQLLAASGRLAEAARELEAASAAASLSAAEYEALAAWYLVLGDDARRQAALQARFGAMSENELAGLLYQAERRLRPGSDGVPPDFDPSVLPALRVLLTKASHPSNYLWWIQRLYQQVRDHRLLASIADAIPGHTPEAAYGMLLGLQNLVGSIHEEATLDQALAHVAVRRQEVERDADRRALDLLTVMLSARAAQVRNADPDHAPRALAALAAAWKLSWVDGEARFVAQVLAGMGRVELPRLAAAQLERLASLDRDATANASVPDRLAIAQARAAALAAYDRADEAVDVLTSVLEAIRASDGAPLPPVADAAFEQRTALLAQQGHFQQAEALLLEETARRTLATRRLGLEQRRVALVANALGRDGAMRHGEGAALLDATTAEVLDWIRTRSAGEAARWVSLLTDLYQGAEKGTAVADAGGRLRRVADAELAPQLDRLALESAGIVNTVASALARLSGPEAALEYALGEQKRSPAFLARIGQDPWTALHWNMANWRREAGRVGVLEADLLALVEDGLEGWLQGGRNVGSGFWQANDRRFWAEKEDEFAATAGRVLELAPGDVTAQHRAASYLRSLGRKAEAVAALAAALDRGAITDAGRLDLAQWLVADGDFARALPLLESLRATYPDRLKYDLLAAQALHGLQRHDEAVSLLTAVRTHHEEEKSWKHAVAAALGRAALELGYLEPAETWLAEAIRLREEELGRRAAADATLGTYYGLLARALGDLGRTDAAVDAASAAVIAWGRDMRQREVALDQLTEVLVRADSLEAWVLTYDARVDAEGVDAAILRKAIATAYEKRGEPTQAVSQWLLARELAPEDASIHQALVAVLDELGREQDALSALLESLRVAPRNLEAAEDLARRYAKAGAEGQAERARTQLAEARPNEAPGHRRLARLFADAGRRKEAVVQLEQVVRTDPLDPTGWLELGEAQLAVGDATAARTSAHHVLEGTWDARFGGIEERAASLLKDAGE